MNNPALEKDITTELQQVCAEMMNKSKIVVCGHVRPDGDCLGSAIALTKILEQKGKTVRLFNEGSIPLQYQFLPEIERVEGQFPSDWDLDLLVCVDCGELDRSGTPENIEVPIVNIDHHRSNSRFGNYVYVDQYACSTAEMILRVSHELDTQITKEIATCLMLGIVADTGGFRYSGTTAESFDTAAELTRAGADVSQIAQELFFNRDSQTIKIMGEVFHSINFEFDKQFAWSEITQEIYDRNGGEEMEPEGLSGALRGIRGVEVSCMLHETADGTCRCSFRSKGNYDVSAIAGTLGGGGHHNASGCLINKPYKEAKEAALKAVRDYFESL